MEDETIIIKKSLKPTSIFHNREVVLRNLGNKKELKISVFSDGINFTDENGNEFNIDKDDMELFKDLLFNFL